MIVEQTETANVMVIAFNVCEFSELICGVKIQAGTKFGMPYYAVR